MNTYKLRIKSNGSKTHLIGDVVVMAESKEDALFIAANEVSEATVDCFEEPQIFTKGVVYVTTKSAWDGYH